MKKLKTRIGAAALCAVLAAYLPAGASAGELSVSEGIEEIFTAETYPEELSVPSEAFSEEPVYQQGEESTPDDGELLISDEAENEWDIPEEEYTVDEILESTDEEIVSFEPLLIEDPEEEEEILENAGEAAPEETGELDPDEGEPAEITEPPSLPAVAFALAEDASADRYFTVPFTPELSVTTGRYSSIVTATLSREEPDADGNVQYTVHINGHNPGIGYVQVYWSNAGKTYNVINYRVAVAQRVYLAEGDTWMEELSVDGITQVVASSRTESVAGIEASVSGGIVTSKITAIEKGIAWLSIEYIDDNGNTIPLKWYYAVVSSPAQDVEVELGKNVSKKFAYNISSAPAIRFTNYDGGVISISASEVQLGDDGKYHFTVSMKALSCGKTTAYLWTGNTIAVAYHVNVTEPTISLKAEPSTLKIGQKGKIRVTCAPWDQVASFSSGYEPVLTVDSKGNYTALKGGTAAVIVTLKSGKVGAVRVNVTVDAPNVKACYNSVNGIDVYWNPVAGADSYEIYRVNRGEKIRVGTAGKNASNFMDKSVKDNCWGRVYVYSVRAKSSLIYSDPGQTFTIQRLAPMAFKSFRSNSARAATLTWDVIPGASNVANGYELQYAESREDLYGRTGTSRAVEIKGRNSLTKTLTGLKSGKTYFFRLRAYVYYTHSVTGKTTRTYSQYCAARAITVK